MQKYSRFFQEELHHHRILHRKLLNSMRECFRLLRRVRNKDEADKYVMMQSDVLQELSDSVIGSFTAGRIFTGLHVLRTTMEISFLMSAVSMDPGLLSNSSLKFKDAMRVLKRANVSTDWNREYGKLSEFTHPKFAMLGDTYSLFRYSTNDNQESRIIIEFYLSLLLCFDAVACAVLCERLKPRMGGAWSELKSRINSLQGRAEQDYDKASVKAKHILTRIPQDESS